MEYFVSKEKFPPVKPEGPSIKEEPFTAVVRHQIKHGMGKPFEKLMEPFIGFVLQQPGHIGISVMRPEHGSRDYTIVDRFVNEAARHAFTSLPEYRRRQDKLFDVSDGEPAIQEIRGLAAWFSLPKYKMAIVTFFGMYPLSILFSIIVTPFPAYRIPSWMIAAIISALIAGSLTWAVMPALTRTFGKWLFYSESKENAYPEN